MISIEDLYVSFDGHQVLKGVSLEIKKGEVVALIGGSGSGKSVLLKHVAGLMQPVKGRVLVDGKDMRTLKGKGLSNLRDRLAFLFQSGALFDSMTVFENVAFPLKEKTGLRDKLIRERVFKELENVGLSGSGNKYPSQISGGMVKRAALARALVMDPEIMLFDEPTTGLDPVIGLAILKLIDSCHKRLSFTGIIVTHEIPRIFPFVDRVAMLHEGVIRSEGTPEELVSIKEPILQAFLGE
ncbi:MAG: ABC transporter ATP-binding protein [Desulfobacteraceae bacterium 4484_190.1]|nr:ATP-binding cassette domain-containing protein [Deltaproteobacteria bacterium]OPX40326.1 MAG: ABC transporter ATP-binding protein [Desulfobacteraceae bacterium 4484_190.1]